MMLGYTLDIDSGDLCALHNAIEPYLELCRAEIAGGNTYPYKGDLRGLESVMARLLASETVLSRYVPAKDGKPARIELGEKLFEPKPKRTRALKRNKKPRHR